MTLDSPRLWLDDIWAALARAVHDRHSAWRTFVFCSCDGGGAPHARNVVLRGLDRGAGSLWFHTHAAAAKVAEVGARPAVAAAFWDPRHSLQLRLEGHAVARTAGDVVAARWAATPPRARTLYAAPMPPGDVLPSAAAAAPAADAAAGAANFCCIDLTVAAVDMLWLRREGHVRARCRRQGDGSFAGAWVQP